MSVPNHNRQKRQSDRIMNIGYLIHSANGFVAFARMPV
jgi:hypothetical protein